MAPRLACKRPADDRRARREGRRATPCSPPAPCRGDFILDNKIDEVKSGTGRAYGYVRCGSRYLNTRIWMSLDPRGEFQPAAGRRAQHRAEPGAPTSCVLGGGIGAAIA